MDDVLSQILDACKLAKELDTSIRLSAVPIDPHYLSSSCEDIAAAFNRAAYLLQSLLPPSQPPRTSQMLFGEPASRMDSDVAGDPGGTPLRGPSSSFQQAIDLLPRMTAPASEDDIGNNPFYAPRMPQGIQSGEAARIGSLEGGSSGRRVEGLGSSSSSSSALAQQRSSRKRKEGTVTKRVPALRTGANVDTPPDDGYTWRKYGQKDILNSNFPRSYYRCTHKSYYGCEAKKQVQRLDEDPYMFEVTYCGTHTCQTSPTPILIPTQLLPPAGAAGADDDDASLMQLEPILQQQQPALPATSQSASPSIQLRNWLESSSPMGLGTLLLPPRSGVSGGGTAAGSSSSRQGGGHSQQGGRDVESTSVAELADAMFNSASSGSSMDVIFSPRHRH